jgi:ferric-dicitrate binding protein FerR (iron transport regulator)
MSEREDIQSELSAEQKAAASAVADLGAPPAREDFQVRLRAAFVAGSLGAATVPTGVRGRLSWLAPLAAAAVLLAMLTLRGQAPLQWDVVNVDAPHVIVDGRTVELDELGAALSEGRTVKVPDGSRVELRAPGLLFLQLNGGVEVELPRRRGEVLFSAVGGAGTLRVATGPRFEGSRYRLQANAAQLEITGTMFAVINGHGDTCICVLEGKVRACAPDEDVMEPIAAGGRMTFHDFGRDVGSGTMLPGEREELSRIRERYDELFSQP